MRRFRYLLLLVAFWLPIQTAYAVAMPFCRHAAERGTVMSASDAGAHCHEHEMTTETQAGQDLDCDDCAVCHLAGAGYLPATVVPIQASSGYVFLALPGKAPQNHIGDPPRQPPRQ